MIQGNSENLGFTYTEDCGESRVGKLASPSGSGVRSTRENCHLTGVSIFELVAEIENEKSSDSAAAPLPVVPTAPQGMDLNAQNIAELLNRVEEH